MPLYGKIIVIKRNGLDGSRFPITKNEIMIGREGDSDIRVQLPNVSLKHCSVTINDNNEAFLENLSDKNPTIFEGKVLADRIKLKNGDVFTIIDRSFRFETLGKDCFTPRRRSRSLSSLSESVRSNMLAAGGDNILSKLQPLSTSSSCLALASDDATTTSSSCSSAFSAVESNKFPPKVLWPSNQSSSASKKFTPQTDRFTKKNGPTIRTAATERKKSLPLPPWRVAGSSTNSMVSSKFMNKSNQPSLTRTPGKGTVTMNTFLSERKVVEQTKSATATPRRPTVGPVESKILPKSSPSIAANIKKTTNFVPKSISVEPLGKSKLFKRTQSPSTTSRAPGSANKPRICPITSKAFNCQTSPPKKHTRRVFRSTYMRLDPPVTGSPAAETCVGNVDSNIIHTAVTNDTNLSSRSIKAACDLKERNMDVDISDDQKEMILNEKTEIANFTDESINAELAVMAIQNDDDIQRSTASTGMAPLTTDICRSPELLSSPKMPSMKSCVTNSSFVETFEGSLGKSVVDAATMNDTNLSSQCVKLDCDLNEDNGGSVVEVVTVDKQTSWKEKSVNASFSNDGTSTNLPIAMIPNCDFLEKPAVCNEVTPLASDLCKSSELRSSPEMFTSFKENCKTISPLINSRVADCSFVETFQGNLDKSVDAASTNDVLLNLLEGDVESAFDVASDDKKQTDEKTMNASCIDESTRVGLPNMTIPNGDFLECPIDSCGSPELLNCPTLPTSFEENRKSISHSNPIVPVNDTCQQNFVTCNVVSGALSCDADMTLGFNDNEGEKESTSETALYSSGKNVVCSEEEHLPPLSFNASLTLCPVLPETVIEGNRKCLSPSKDIPVADDELQKNLVCDNVVSDTLPSDTRNALGVDVSESEKESNKEIDLNNSGENVDLTLCPILSSDSSPKLSETIFDENHKSLSSSKVNVRGSVKDETPTENFSVQNNYESEKESDDERANYLRSNQNTSELTHTVDIGASSPKSKKKKLIRKSRGVTDKAPFTRRNRKHTSPFHPLVGDNVIADALLRDSPKIEIVKDLPASEKSTAEVKRPVRGIRGTVKDEAPAGKNHESKEESNDEPLEYLPSSQKTSELANKEGIDAASPTSKKKKYTRNSRTVIVKTPSKRKARRRPSPVDFFQNNVVSDDVICDLLLRDSPVAISVVETSSLQEKESKNEVGDNLPPSNRPVRSVRGTVKNKTPAKKSSVRQNHESEKESNDDAVVDLTAIQKTANMEDDNETVWCSKTKKSVRNVRVVNVITPAKSEKSTNEEGNSVKRPVRSVRAAVKDKSSAGKNHESDKESNDDAVDSQNISEVANNEEKKLNRKAPVHVKTHSTRKNRQVSPPEHSPVFEQRVTRSMRKKGADLLTLN